MMLGRMYDINMYIFICLHMRVKGHHHYCGVCFARPISKLVLQARQLLGLKTV